MYASISQSEMLSAHTNNTESSNTQNESAFPKDSFAYLASSTNDMPLVPPAMNYRLNNTSGRTIDLTGLSNTGVNSGRILRLVSIGSAPIVIKNQSKNSVAGDRFNLPGGADITLTQKCAATFFYDGDTWTLQSAE
jgi:hypothetical protein